jgi:hypothetical protein
MDGSDPSNIYDDSPTQPNHAQYDLVRSSPLQALIFVCSLCTGS